MEKFNLNEAILYEDHDLIVLNKPVGILSIEDGYDREKINLRSILREKYNSIWTVHRLDKDTSGIIIFAKNEESHRELNLSFSNRQAVKNYRGIIYGIPVWDSYEINLPLKVNGDRKHRTVIDSLNGKPASTKFIKLNNNIENTYIDIFPLTGLTHQIRAHLSAIGFPIFGDHLYWRCCGLKGILKLSQENCFLHAMILKIDHPISKIPMTINAPLPTLFLDMLATLKLIS